MSVSWIKGSTLGKYSAPWLPRKQQGSRSDVRFRNSSSSSSLSWFEVDEVVAFACFDFLDALVLHERRANTVIFLLTFDFFLLPSKSSTDCILTSLPEEPSAITTSPSASGPSMGRVLSNCDRTQITSPNSRNVVTSFASGSRNPVSRTCNFPFGERKSFCKSRTTKPFLTCNVGVCRDNRSNRDDILIDCSGGRSQSSKSEGRQAGRQYVCAEKGSILAQVGQHGSSDH